MKISIIILCLSALLSSINIFGKNDTVSICTPKDLQCEYLFNPIGIDDVAPRLSWRLNDSRQGAFQSAYNIVVGTDSLAVLQGVGNMWNTAMVSDSSMLATYLGKELQPYAKYFWAVQLWDKDGVKGSLSQVASFETGLMRQENWQGKWICDVEDIKLKPAPYFRKEFSASKEIVGARAYITAAGLFELFINGKRVGDQVLDPAYTHFDKRNLYITHDVTHLVKESNAIGVLLGNGWYNHQSTAVWDFHKAPWRARPRFCMDLRITYADGSTETISTDESWKTSLCPVVFNSIYTAEHYDARREQSGWNKSGFDDSKWKNSHVVNLPSQNITAQLMHPIRHIDELKPVSIRRVSTQKYIFDLGRGDS